MGNIKKYKKIVMIIILTLIFVITCLISFQTKLDSHPDERVHYEAVKYYQNHNIPPKFTDDDIIDSFSVHGESRLTELDSYYFFVGKYTSILNIITSDSVYVFNARSFNLILLAIILIMCYKLYKNQNYLFMPFLFTSQVWYIFSYINNDAWAIFLNLIFVYQLFFRKSMFNKYINEQTKKENNRKLYTVGRVFLLGLLFYFLLITKTNYLVATGISAVLYLIINNKTIFKKDKIIKIGVILLVGFIALGVRLGIDYGINRLDRIKNMEQVRLLRAEEQFKPPYPAGDKNGNFRWKQRGKTINNVTQNKEFYKKTANSFIGVYGYMNKYAPDVFYYIILSSYIIFIVYLFINNIKNRKTIMEDNSVNKGRIIPLILVLLSGILTLGLSIYRSYTYDFQPQGRYLFPIIPLMCAIMYNQKKNKWIEWFSFTISIILIIMYMLFGYLKFL